MRRKHVKPPPYKIRSKEPWFFWYACSACDDEVKREKIWVVTRRYYRKMTSRASPMAMGTKIDTYIFCARCCSTEENALDEYITRFEDIYV